MFGYLFMDKEKLTLEEKKIFRDYYCSICLSLKYNYGNLMRFTLNYDIVYLAMIVDYGTEIRNCGRCGKYIDDARDVFRDEYWKNIANYNTLLLAQKLRDDIIDRKKVSYKICNKFLIKRITSQGLFKPYSLMAQKLNAYYSIESSDMPVEQKIHIFADCMCDTVQLFFHVDKNRLNLLHVIFQIIVLLDAVDDFEDDKKRGGISLLIEYAKEQPSAMRTQLFKLGQRLNEVAQKYYVRCQFGKKVEIILNNLIYDYLPVLTEKIFTGNYKKERRKIL